jgi:hypothetical protein
MAWFWNISGTFAESSHKCQAPSAAVIVTTNASVDSGNQSDPYVEESCKWLHTLVFFSWSEFVMVTEGSRLINCYKIVTLMEYL